MSILHVPILKQLLKNNKKYKKLIGIIILNILIFNLIIKNSFLLFISNIQ